QPVVGKRARTVNRAAGQVEWPEAEECATGSSERAAIETECTAGVRVIERQAQGAGVHLHQRSRQIDKIETVNAVHVSDTRRFADRSLVGEGRRQSAGLIKLIVTLD